MKKIIRATATNLLAEGPLPEGNEKASQASIDHSGSADADDTVAELVIANKELAFQNEEKGKRAAELVVANKELVFQNEEKGKRAAELVVANKELAFQNEEKDKRAAELKQSKDQLQLLLDSTAEAIYGIDMHGDCTFCNSACLQMLGYEREDELLGKNMHWQIHHKYADGTRFPVEECRIFRAFQANEGSHVDDEVLWRADGTSFPAEYWSYPQRVDGAAVGAVVTFIDITERVRTALLLQESEGRFRRMADSAPVLLWESDTDGLCNYFNKTWLDFTGRTLEQELGNGWAENVHPEDFQRCLGTYMEAFHARRGFEMEYRLRRADGEYRWLDDHGVPRFMPDGSFLGFIGSCIDITESKHAEEERKRLANRLSLATKAGQVGIWDLDVANNILIWDDQMYRLYGITRDQFGGAYEAWTEGLHPDDRERGDAEIQMALRGEKDFDTEFRVVWPNGGIHHIRAMALVQRNATGEPIHLVGTNWDITEIKRAEGVVLQNLARAEELTRLKSRFVSMASHELRTPLANIMLDCDLLKNFGNVMPAEQSQSVLAGLMTGVSSMVRTLDDLLLAGKLEEGKLPFTPTRFPLLDFLRRGCLEIEPELPSRIKITFLDAGLDITADERLLHHILINLLENALKYSPHGTKVELCVETGPDSLTLSVLDHGIGVPEAERTFLFDAFSRASNVGDKPGSGLGLFLAQKCAQAHGGQMRYTPLLDGSVFSVTIPLAADTGFKPTT